MAETISDLLDGVCGILLAGEIVSVIGPKAGTSLDTTILHDYNSRKVRFLLLLNILFKNRQDRS